eukprot:6177167-Pleurochrysis_carterae.AAC.3
MPGANLHLCANFSVVLLNRRLHLAAALVDTRWRMPTLSLLSVVHAYALTRSDLASCGRPRSLSWARSAAVVRVAPCLTQCQCTHALRVRLACLVLRTVCSALP